MTATKDMTARGAVYSTFPEAAPYRAPKWRDRLWILISDHWRNNWVTPAGQCQAYPLYAFLGSILPSVHVPADEREPFTFHYMGTIVSLAIDGHLDLSKAIWAVRNRPAAVCGRKGSFAVAKWLLDQEA